MSRRGQSSPVMLSNEEMGQRSAAKYILDRGRMGIIEN